MMGSQLDVTQQALQALYPEEIYRQFEGDNNAWTLFDSRVQWLLEFTKSQRNNKVLVITAKSRCSASTGRSVTHQRRHSRYRIS